jgi:uroporphyrin-III C-methyltransferase
MLVAFALEGLTVVRLKGGDPFVFGRGGEELEACREAGVRCDVIPGVTAALAAAASAGAPLTHRGAAQAVTFVTGHARSGEDPDLDWVALARPNQTVVIYMGLASAASIAGRLIGAGRSGSTPALVVENASLPGERRVPTTLGELAAAVAGLDGPALLMIGEAMALARAGHEMAPNETVDGAIGVGGAAPC